MPRVLFQGSTYEVGAQSALDCLTAQGHVGPSACRAGVCQSCLMRAVRGGVPEQAQHGMTPTMVARNLFVACQCFPTQDLEVALADDVIERIEADVAAIEFMNNEIRAVHIRPLTPFEYPAGPLVG